MNAVPRALVTGFDGFTGKYIAAGLESAGYQVIGLSHTAEGDKNTIRVDLLDRMALQEAVASLRPDVVIHLAAISFVPHGDPETIYRVNLVGTRNLLESLVAAGVAPRAVVLASSANVYGNSTCDPIDEAAPLAPANDYAVSKLAMEYMAKLWMDRLPIIIVRPFNYTGLGQGEQFLIPKIVAHFRKCESTIELGNMNVWRDFSDVRDVTRAYLGLIDKAPAGSVFNICSGRAHSLAEVLDLMSEIAGYNIIVKVNSAFVRDNEVSRLVGSNEKLQSVTGVPMAIPLRETLLWMYTSPPAL